MIVSRRPPTSSVIFRNRPRWFSLRSRKKIFRSIVTFSDAIGSEPILSPGLSFIIFKQLLFINAAKPRWFGKSEAKRTAFTPSNATLVFDAQRSVNPTETENIIIEGENLEVLKVLQKSYYNKVKCIIIDPPYNTGNDSFIYPDSFKENKADYEKRKK